MFATHRMFKLMHFFLPAALAHSVWPAGPKIALCFPHLFVGLCAPTYHMCNNYATYIVICDFTVVNISSCLYSVVWHSYKFKIDTEKQRWHRHDNARLTKSRNARSEQLLVMPTELQLRMAARRTLEWVEMFEGPSLGARIEIWGKSWEVAGKLKLN